MSIETYEMLLGKLELYSLNIMVYLPANRVRFPQRIVQAQSLILIKGESYHEKEGIADEFARGTSLRGYFGLFLLF